MHHITLRTTSHQQVSYTQNPASAGFFDADYAMLFDGFFA